MVLSHVVNSASSPISRTGYGANSQHVEEFLQAPESRLRINGIRLRSPASLRDPIAIPSYLIDFLDTVRVEPLKDLKHTVETAVLDLFCGVGHNLKDEGMAQPTLLVLDFGEDLSPDDGLEHGKKDEHREVVEMIQAERRARRRSLRPQGPSAFVPCRARHPRAAHPNVSGRVCRTVEAVSAS